MNVRNHFLFQTGTFEVWDVLQDGEKCEDDEVQGGDGEVGMARWRLESRERCWGQGEDKREGKAAWVEEAGPGRGCQAGGGCIWRGKDGEVEIVKWRWQGGKNHRKICEEWRHPGSVKIYGKTMSY